MRKNTLFFISVLGLIAVLGGFFRFRFVPWYNAWQAQQQASLTTSPQPSPAAALTTHQAEVATQIAKLSPEQKIAQLMFLPVVMSNSTTATIAAQPLIEKWQPAGVTLFGTAISTSSAQRTIASLKTVSPQLLISVDHEGGSVQRLNGAGFTKLPSWPVVCDQEAVVQQHLFEKSAGELEQVGVTVVMAPVVDVATASTSAMQNRACASSVQTTQTAQQYLAAFQQHHILPIIKHFPGIGSSTKDSHLTFEQIQLDPTQLQIFTDLLTGPQPVAVMSSHLGILDDPEELPCSLSAQCLNTLKQKAPNALIFSDALEMTSASHSKEEQIKPLPVVARQAVEAGNTILVFGPGVSSAELEAVFSELLSAYTNSSEFRATVDRNVEKIVEYKVFGAVGK